MLDWRCKIRWSLSSGNALHCEEFTPKGSFILYNDVRYYDDDSVSAVVIIMLLLCRCNVMSEIKSHQHWLFAFKVKIGLLPFFPSPPSSIFQHYARLTPFHLHRSNSGLRMMGTNFYHCYQPFEICTFMYIYTHQLEKLKYLMCVTRSLLLLYRYILDCITWTLLYLICCPNEIMYPACSSVKYNIAWALLIHLEFAQ